MKVSYILGLEDLDAVREVIKNYTPKEIPHMTTRLNHVRVKNEAKIRLTIEGDDNDVKGLVDILTSSFFLS